MYSWEKKNPAFAEVKTRIHLYENRRTKMAIGLSKDITDSLLYNLIDYLFVISLYRYIFICKLFNILLYQM